VHGHLARDDPAVLDGAGLDSADGVWGGADGARRIGAVLSWLPWSSCWTTS
jgi:hypothetical protein